MDDIHKGGTRIFKKSTPNGKLTIYLGKRDFFDHLTHVDPVEGVVLVDPEYVKDRKVFVHLLGAFRYGRDEVDLLGMSCHNDLYLSTRQVYPALSSNTGVSYTTGTNEERLIRKLGANAYPFYFQLPAYSASSVSLYTHASDTCKSCRVDYELKVFVADEQDDTPQKRNSVRMIIRKLTYAPEEPGPQPSVEVLRDFLMSVGSLRVEVSLDKQKYHHGETMCVNVLVDNNSNKTVKRIRISVRQYVQVILHTSVAYKCTVAEIHSDEGFPIYASQTGWCKVYRVCPSLASNRDKTSLAMDGDLKHEGTNLASSTIVPPKHLSNDSIGIHVQYKVKVRLTLGFGVSDVCLQLPFILTHPNPKESASGRSVEEGDLITANSSRPCPPKTVALNTSAPIGTNSIVKKSDASYKTATRNGDTPVPPKCDIDAVLKLDAPFTFDSSPARPSKESENNHHENGNSHNSIQSVEPTLLSLLPTTPVRTDMAPFENRSHLVYGERSPLSQTPDTRSIAYAFNSVPLTKVCGARQPPSTAGTQSTMSEDDLIFEDFARLRLRANTDTPAANNAIFHQPGVFS
ncbi:S-antigen visual arrestin [Paragonimus heterotremus]|uniref:S-antigen visual arrestin n=1 Tax=Paragonimus heterotremus TaxID=100268 RepID=A0A8J4WSU1_9TREM|nr:S-antigen visual arrestin [Paragonimus heterotremus]